ncbi:hypothetical protein FSP39_025089 [Pinctada imbricata]|uniref:TLC domain-containing protein n=1 Tax=Pinctada imbricata TaxID=66713 RepID=A0AA88XUD0_PINIB|nr:hypothetical protein FSP39_025089 [Pinctada imbricata]
MVRLDPNLPFETRYYPAAVVSFAFFLAIFKFVTPKVTRKFFKDYDVLDESKRIDWDARVNSSIHAVIVCTTCVCGFLYDEDISEEPICSVMVTMIQMHHIFFVFSFSDMILLTMYWKQIGDVVFFLHHGASVYAYVYVMSFGVLPWFANYRLLAEFSTVFVNNRYFFDTMKYLKTHPMAFSNGIMMTLSFFVARIVTMPHYWYKVYTVYGTADFTNIGHIQLVLLISCFVLDVLNILWFYKMCKGVLKVLSGLDKNRNEMKKES